LTSHPEMPSFFPQVERLLEGVHGRTRWYQRCWHGRTVTQSSATHMVVVYSGEIEVDSFAG
jgi:hypothetical protein